MTVRELFKGILNDMPAFFNTYRKNFTIIDEIDSLKMTEDDIIAAHAIFADNAKRFIENFVNMPSGLKPCDCVLFVVSNIDVSGKTRTLSSFYCYKDEISRKISNFSLWDGDDDTRIEHYGYDMSPLEDIIDMDVFIDESVICNSKEEGFNRPNILAACDIFRNLTFFGIKANDREKRIEELVESLTKSIEEIESGNMEYFTADEVFDKLFSDISSIDSQEHQERENPDDITKTSVVLSINHRICQNAVARYWVEQVISLP